MKKFISMLLVLAFLITASACSNSNGQTADNSSSVSVEQSSKAEESGSLNTTSNQTVTTSKQQNTTSTQKSESSSSKKPASSSSKPTASSVTSIITPPIDTIKPIEPQSSNTTTGTYRFETVKEMCESPELKEQVDALNNSFSSLGLRIEIVAEGNKVVYLYKFSNPVDAETTKPALEAGIEAQKETFNQTVRDIQAEIKEKVVLCIRYLNADGTVICQAEFPQ